MPRKRKLTLPPPNTLERRAKIEAGLRRRVDEIVIRHHGEQRVRQILLEIEKR